MADIASLGTQYTEKPKRLPSNMLNSYILISNRNRKNSTYRNKINSRMSLNHNHHPDLQCQLK